MIFKYKLCPSTQMYITDICVIMDGWHTCRHSGALADKCVYDPFLSHTGRWLLSSLPVHDKLHCCTWILVFLYLSTWELYVNPLENLWGILCKNSAFTCGCQAYLPWTCSLSAHMGIIPHEWWTRWNCQHPFKCHQLGITIFCTIMPLQRIK
jgi:hypothetical protein